MNGTIGKAENLDSYVSLHALSFAIIENRYTNLTEYGPVKKCSMLSWSVSQSYLRRALSLEISKPNITFFSQPAKLLV
jgi:hypothetical protein